MRKMKDLFDSEKLKNKARDEILSSHVRSCVEISGILLIPHCLCLPNSDGYLMEVKMCLIMSGSSYVHTCLM